MNNELRSLRTLLLLFMITLAISGLTAIPVEQGLSFLNRVFPPGTWAGDWFSKVYHGFRHTNQHYPFLAYGYDWLAFAHLVLAILFYGPLKDPVRNKWVIEFGMIACVLVIPWALFTGEIRQIPWWWRLVDCSFGVVGYSLLWICRKKIRRMEQHFNSEKSHYTSL